MLLKYLIQKVAQENVPEIERKSCLHYKNAHDPCEDCVKACPTSAIVKNGHTLVIEDDLCMGCGICRVECPSQSITMKNFGEKGIPKAIEKNKSVVFGCHLGKAEGNAVVPCLNGLHPELLVILFLHFRNKKLTFNLSKCRVCSIKPGSATFQTSLKKTLGFLDQLQVDYQHEVIYQDEAVPEITPGLISRRDLFDMIKQDTTSHAIDMFSSMWGKGIDNSLNQRQILLDLMNQIGKDKTFEINADNNLLSNFEVNRKCSGCSYCAAICPYKAWKVEEAQDTYTLSHHAGQCRNCSLCMKTCPENAIEKANLSSNALVGYHEKMVKMTIKCKKCRKPYVVNEDDKGLCTACSKRENLRKSLLKEN